MNISEWFRENWGLGGVAIVSTEAGRRRFSWARTAKRLLIDICPVVAISGCRRSTTIASIRKRVGRQILCSSVQPKSRWCASAQERPSLPVISEWRGWSRQRLWRWKKVIVLSTQSSLHITICSKPSMVGNGIMSCNITRVCFQQKRIWNLLLHLTKVHLLYGTSGCLELMRLGFMMWTIKKSLLDGL